MGKRELFALAAIPVLVSTIIWLPSWAFLAVLGLAVVLACGELLSMARAAGLYRGRWLPLISLTVLLVLSWILGVSGFAAAAMATLLILPTARLAHPEAPTGNFGGVAAECLAVLYLGATAACFGWLRLWPGDDMGVRLLLFFLASIWVGDSGAYYVGRNFGRHKMSPRISPNKTWEGLAGGIVTTYAAAAAASAIFELGIGPIHTMALATILAITAPLGDLVESQFKRDSGIKDSSTVLPGHGGFLDRTDSLLYAAPPVLGYLLVAGLLQ
jgi:phosphatidate cytidylyltransferase